MAGRRRVTDDTPEGFFAITPSASSTQPPQTGPVKPDTPRISSWGERNTPADQIAKELALLMGAMGADLIGTARLMTINLDHLADLHPHHGFSNEFKRASAMIAKLVARIEYLGIANVRPAGDHIVIPPGAQTMMQDAAKKVMSTRRKP